MLVNTNTINNLGGEDYALINCLGRVQFPASLRSLEQDMLNETNNQSRRETMNTQDLSKFGYREKDMTGDLLKAHGTSNDTTRYLGAGVSVEFNPMSGNVFLVDEEYNAAMMNGDKLEDFFSCPICGHEGFLEEMVHGDDDEECQEYLKSINS